MENKKQVEQVEKEVIPVFEYIKVIAEEGYEWLEKGTRLHYEEEIGTYFYNYDVTVTNEDGSQTFEQAKQYLLSIQIAHQGVLDGIFEYGGALVTDTEFIENGE